MEQVPLYHVGQVEEAPAEHPAKNVGEGDRQSEPVRVVVLVVALDVVGDQFRHEYEEEDRVSDAGELLREGDPVMAHGAHYYRDHVADDDQHPGGCQESLVLGCYKVLEEEHGYEEDRGEFQSALDVAENAQHDVTVWDELLRQEKINAKCLPCNVFGNTRNVKCTLKAVMNILLPFSRKVATQVDLKCNANKLIMNKVRVRLQLLRTSRAILS